MADSKKLRFSILLVLKNFRENFRAWLIEITISFVVNTPSLHYLRTNLVSFEAMQHIILRKLWLSKKKSNNKSIRLTYSMWNHYYQHWNHTNMFLPRSHGVWFDFPSIHNLKQRKKERDLLTNTQVLKQGIYFFLKYGK